MRFFRKNYLLSEKDQLWNRFIEELSNQPLSVLSPTQKTAVVAFGYDAEMNSGGHIGYFEWCPDVEPEELMVALKEIGAPYLAENYQRARLTGLREDYQAADCIFYSAEPSLTQLLMDYIEAHKSELF